MGIRKSRRRRKDKWGNRMALIGITAVVLSLAVAVNLKGATLRDKDLAYQERVEALEREVAAEEARSRQLEQYQKYVQTKEYIEKVARQKLGLVKPGEIVLKPKENK